MNVPTMTGTGVLGRIDLVLEGGIAGSGMAGNLTVEVMAEYISFELSTSGKTLAAVSLALAESYGGVTVLGAVTMVAAEVINLLPPGVRHCPEALDDAAVRAEVSAKLTPRRAMCWLDAFMRMLRAERVEGGYTFHIAELGWSRPASDVPAAISTAAAMYLAYRLHWLLRPAGSDAD